MTADRETTVRDLVESFVEPHLNLSLGAVRAIQALRVDGSTAHIDLQLGFPAAGYAGDLSAALKHHLEDLDWLERVEVQITAAIESHAVQRNLRPIQGIKNIIAVASGKGGVGKSTTAANLALALAADGATVGMLDADIYGPSQPRMMGLSGEKPTSPDQKTVNAPVGYGVKVMSIGFMIDEEQPMVWRGPMVTQALVQLLETTRWGQLDYLIVDMPPGTGDTQLTLSQRVPVSGAVIVTTPQDIALLDARKGLKMFQKVEVPVLGIVENMSTHVCSKCGHEEHIFGAGGGRRMAEQYGVDLLAELPLDIRIREQADAGKPTVVAEPNSNLGRAYIEMSRHIAGRLAASSQKNSGSFPTISVEDT
jgi:ATP-binding protein involved in chromosome partitioning